MEVLEEMKIRGDISLVRPHIVRLQVFIFIFIFVLA